MLDFRIETFLCVCKYMNFTKASAALNITQPAVSQHIHYLEDEYSAKLFEYKNRKLSLTPAGEELYRAALTMKHDDRILAKRMKLAGQPVRKLSFGATLTVGGIPLSRQGGLLSGSQSQNRYPHDHPQHP